MNRPRILIAEDSKVIAINLKLLLEGLGYTVCGIVETGQEVLSAINEKKPNLVLMDIYLKGDMDGITAAEEIKQRFNIPVIYLTSSSDEKTLDRAKVTDPFGYIIKPVTEVELRSTIETALYKFKMEQKLKESEKKYRSIVAAIPDILIIYDHKGDYIDIKASEDNRLLAPPEKLQGKNIKEVLPKNIARKMHHYINKALISDGVQAFEYSLPIGGEDSEFEARLVAYGDDQVVAIIRDITEEKKSEEKLKYISLHDQLTGLYNRTYFEEELERLKDSREYPITIISADLDGLKLINDSMGHKQGDDLLKACAELLKKPLRKSDFLARVGGDEFITVLPRVDVQTGQSIVERIKAAIEGHNNENPKLPISISFGVASSTKPEHSLKDVLKEADDLMYKEKLYQSAKARSQMVKTLLTALSEKDFIAEGHAVRVQKICASIGKLIGFSDNKIAELELLAQVHDVGKVGLPENILIRNKSLTSEEREIIKRHPEIGYRIARSSPDFAKVSEAILRHHENWDGTGYPLGIKGKEIPIECRVLAIADAFDIMTNSQMYGKVKGKEEAIREIEQGAGKQFDPAICKKVLEEPSVLYFN